MRIAITGADGYIGVRLCKRLSENKDFVIKRLSFVSGENGLIKTDYSVDSLVPILEDVDLVIHLASVRSGDSISVFYPNLSMTENLLIAMGQCSVHKLIFMSSIAVYSEIDNLPWNESQPVKPYTLYGIGKSTCEDLCEYYGKRFDITHLIIRLSPIYGPNDTNKRMIAVFSNNAREGKPISVRGKSVAKRDFIFVDDVIDALLLLLQKFPDRSDIFNVGSVQRLNNYEIAKIIVGAYGARSELIYDDKCSEGICSAYSDISKIESLGFTPTSMKDAFSIIAKQEGIDHV